MTLTTVTLPGPSGTPVPLAAWGTPMTNNVNELITDITPAVSAWTAFTPTWGTTGTAPSLGNGTVTGRFMQFGKVGFFDGVFTAGSTSTYGTGTFTFALPTGWTAAGGAGTLVGDARLLDTSVSTRYVGVIYITASTTITVTSNAATTDVSGTVPFTFATGDVIRWCGTVELT